MYTLNPFSNELCLDIEWVSLLKAGDTNVFKKFLKKRTEEFFITSDEDRERHLKGKFYIDETDCYPRYEDKIIESLTPRSRLEYILIVLNGGVETHNNLDILYALLHNYHLICNELSPRVIDALKLGIVDVKKFSCFLEISQKWNNILNELSLAFDTNLKSLIVDKNDWKEYSQWDDFAPMPDPQKSIEEYLKPHLTKKLKKVEADISNYPEQGALFKNTIKEITPPESTEFNLVIEYIQSSYLDGYSSEILEMVEAIKLNNIMIWVYKDNRRYIAISNDFPAVIHSYKNPYNKLSPKELSVQVYTFGVKYKPRFSYGWGNGNWSCIHCNKEVKPSHDRLISNYSIDEYHNDLKEYLSVMGGYEDCGWYTYPWIRHGGFRTHEKEIFILLLSLFVMADLVIFCYFSEHYKTFRKEMKVPKFEYGLTFTYLYPNVIIERELGGISHDLFERALRIFERSIGSFFNKHGISKFEFRDCIMNDEDLKLGMFGSVLRKFF